MSPTNNSNVAAQLIPGKLYRVKEIQGVVRSRDLAGGLSMSRKPEFHYVMPDEVFMITRIVGVFNRDRFVEILWKEDFWVCPKSKIVKEEDMP